MDKKESKRESYNYPVSIKLTKAQKDIWDKNKWIANEIRDMVRERLNIYITNDK